MVIMINFQQNEDVWIVRTNHLDKKSFGFGLRLYVVLKNKQNRNSNSNFFVRFRFIELKALKAEQL